MIPFGDWKPDLGSLNSGQVVTATGCLPLATGWGPWKSLTSYGSAVAATPLGGFMSRKNDGTRNVWTGTATRLYKFNRSTLAWDDVTRIVGGNYGATSRWNFIQFGPTLIAHNVNDLVQSIDIEAGTNYAALAGTPPQARYGGVVKDFVVLGNLTASNPNRIQWSAINDVTGWTIGTNQSDFQDFPDYGEVTGVLGGEVGFIFQQECVRRLTYVGPPLIFQIDVINDKRGCKAPFSLVRIGNTAFYLSPEGFTALSISGESQLIDLGAVNEFFQNDADLSDLPNVRGIGDPGRSRIFWIYRSRSNPTNFDRVLCFDYGLKRWALSTSLEIVDTLQAAVAGSTLEGMDTYGTLETITFSFDDPALSDGLAQFAAFDAMNKLAFLSGHTQEVLLETADIEFTQGRRSFVTGVRPQVDTTNVYLRLGEKALPSSAISYTTEATPETSTGLASFRSDARYHAVRARIPADTTWTRIIGVDGMARPTGLR